MSDLTLHSPAVRARVPFRRALVSVAAILGAHGLAGCAMSFPMSSMMPASDEVTGSLARVPFGQLLDEEDRRREKAALATALDPQGDGTTVHWENAKSGTKGSITAVGRPYPTPAHICRAFTSDLGRTGLSRSMSGTACMESAGEWVVKDAKPLPKA